MTKGDAGQNISKFASSSTDASQISTSLPYISYIDLGSWLQSMYEHARDAVNAYFLAHSKVAERSATGFLSYCQVSQNYSDVFVCDGYRLCRAAKLLMALGYGNFDTIIQYDIYALAEALFADFGSWDVDDFQDSNFSLDFSVSDVSSILNSPNLSILPTKAKSED